VSKQLDDYSGPYGNQDFFKPPQQLALSAYNSPQYFQLSYFYEFPFGSDKPLFRYSGWRGPLVKGWSVSGTAYWNDGRPLAIHPEYNKRAACFPPSTSTWCPVWTRTWPIRDRHSGSTRRLSDQPADFTLGMDPGPCRTCWPGFNSMNLSVNKRQPVGRQLRARVQRFGLNFLNHANWNYPDQNIGPASAPNVNAGKIIGSYGGRVIQVGLNFSF